MQDPAFPSEGEKIKKEAREIYNKIEYVWSSALGDRVFFNSTGFRHLVWKGKEYRSSYQQHKRLALLPFAPNIIANAKIPNSRRIEVKYTKIKWHHEKKKALSNITYWSFKGESNGKPVRVIVRQIGNGHKHFFSIFQDHK